MHPDTPLTTLANAEIIRLLNDADFLAPLSGLYGRAALDYCHLASSFSHPLADKVIWKRLASTSHQTHNLALPLHLLDAHEPKDDSDWIAFGHMLRHTAHDSEGSALAYQQVESPLHAFICLQRLIREFPKCQDANHIVNSLAVSFLKNSPSLQKFRQSKALTTDEYINAAYAAIAIGDIGLALDCCEAMLQIDRQNPEGTEIVSAIAQCVSDNPAFFSRALQLLVRSSAWSDIAKADFTHITHVDTHGHPQSVYIMLSMVYAMHLDDEIHASDALLHGAIDNPTQWAHEIRQNAWICLYACDHPHFMQTLFEAIDIIHDHSLYTAILSFLSKFTKKDSIKDSATLRLLRHYAHSGKWQEALKQIKKNSRLKKFDTECYDILADICSLFPSDPKVLHLVLETSDVLYNEGGDHDSLRSLLLNMYEISYSMGDDTLQDQLSQRIDRIDALDSDHLPSPSTPQELRSALNSTPRHRQKLILRHFDLCLQDDILFELVLKMSDKHTLKPMFDKLDAAIRACRTNIPQRNALYKKKYKIARIRGDEDLQLECLREIVKAMPSDKFAQEELKSIISPTSKPHSRPRLKLTSSWLQVAEIFNDLGNILEAVHAVERAIDVETDGQQKMLMLLELAKQYSSIDMPEESYHAFHEALLYDPSPEMLSAAAESIISHATASKNKTLFNDVCTDLISLSDPNEQISLMLQQAATLIRVFKDTETARTIIDNNTSRLTALDLKQSILLASILTDTAQNAFAVRVLQGVLNGFSLSDPECLTCLNLILKNAVALDDQNAVKSTANAILIINPENTEAKFQLAVLDYKAGRWNDAASKIQSLLNQPQNLTNDMITRLYTNHAEIKHATGDDRTALLSLNEALKASPECRSAVDLKLSILLENKEWNKALPVFRTLLRLTEDPEVKGAIHKRIGELFHFYLNDPVAAITEYEQALTLGGDISDVPIRLFKLYSQTEMWEKAAITAQILAQAQTESIDARCDYLIALADIQANHLNDTEKATASLLDAFELDPTHENLLLPLTEIFKKTKNWDSFDAIVERLSDCLTENPIRASGCLYWFIENFKDETNLKSAVSHAKGALFSHSVERDMSNHYSSLTFNKLNLSALDDE